MKITGAMAISKGAALPSMFPFEFGGYRVTGLLGRCGIGAVYEAEQIATGTRVALKVLGQGMDSDEMRKRFLREGRLAAAVTQPNSFLHLRHRGDRRLAGRLRMLGRWLIAWVPFLLQFAKQEIAALAHKNLATADIVKFSFYGLVWVLGIIAAIIRPPQGMHDEQTKTWIVPR